MNRLGFPVFRFESISSTMDEIDRLARDGAAEGTAVIAQFQAQGRGRSGRIWQVSPGSSFLCSVLLRPMLRARDITSLPLVVGVAIAEAIDEVGGVRSSLKWPNDVYVNNKKICGILAQSRTVGEQIAFVNLGIGVNLNVTRYDLPETGTSLRIETGQNIDLAAFEEAVFRRLTLRYREFLDADGRPSLGPWLDRAMFVGQEVEITQSEAIVIGKFVGVSADGSLELVTTNGPQRIVIGELTRGPRAAAI